LRLLATLGERTGGIPREQRQMIHAVLDLSARRVEDVAVPLIDMVAVERGTDLARFIEVADSSGFSRIPVYEGRIDNVVGIVHILDVIHADPSGGTVDPFIRSEIHFVPESKNIQSLLTEIQRGPHTMVFPVDEHGGITGLVTIEDLVEEVVGELADERVETETIRLIGPRLMECEGKTEVDVLVEEYGIPIPVGDYETIAGYVLERLGRIPGPGDHVETPDFIVTVTEADARTVRSVRIRNTTTNFGGRAQQQGLVPPHEEV
jgi:CBS domain containing-hemolysin-like protein